MQSPTITPVVFALIQEKLVSLPKNLSETQADLRLSAEACHSIVSRAPAETRLALQKMGKLPFNEFRETIRICARKLENLLHAGVQQGQIDDSHIDQVILRVKGVWTYGHSAPSRVSLNEWFHSVAKIHEAGICCAGAAKVFNGSGQHSYKWQMNSVYAALLGAVAHDHLFGQ